MPRIAEEAAAEGTAHIDLVRAHFALALVLRHQGHFTAAHKHAHVALALAGELDARDWRPWTPIQLGEIPGITDAEGVGEEALNLLRTLGSEWGQVTALLVLAFAAVKRNDTARAAALYLESLALRETIGDRWGMIDTLLHLAALVASRAGAPLQQSVWFPEPVS